MVQDIREIDLRRISPNLRIVIAAECIEEIEHGIKRCGQQEPIVICFEHDSFRIIDGEKRWRACKRLGFKKIWAIIA